MLSLEAVQVVVRVAQAVQAVIPLHLVVYINLALFLDYIVLLRGNNLKVKSLLQIQIQGVLLGVILKQTMGTYSKMWL